MNAEFDREYDISQHFYVDGTDKKIPSKIEIKVSDAVPENNGFNFNVRFFGHYYRWHNENYSENWTGQVFEYVTNEVREDSKIITFDLSNDNINALRSYDTTEFSDAKLQIINYYSANDWNNIKIEYIKFIY